MSKEIVLFRTKTSESSLSLGNFGKTSEIYVGEEKKKDKGKKKKLHTLFARTS